MRPVLAALAWLAALASGAGGAEECFYLVTYRGEVIGVSRVRVEEVSKNGEKLIRVTTSEETYLATRGRARRTVTERTELVRSDWSGIELSETRRESGSTRELRIEVEPEAVTFHTRLAGVSRAFRASRTSDRPVFFDLDGRALASRGLLGKGSTFKALVAARVELGLAELEATVVSEDEDPSGLLSTREARDEGGVFKIRVSNAGGGGEPWEIACDGEGKTISLKIGPMVQRRVPKEAARLPRRPVHLSNVLRTQPLGRPWEVREMTVYATVPGSTRTDLFPDSVYCRAELLPDGRYRLRLKLARPDGRLGREDLSEDERKRLLSPTPLVECDAPEIARLAGRIAGDGEEDIIRLLELLRWVHGNIRKRNRGPAISSALECLRSRAGDCTEHAVLLVALARALGIPAREVVGLVHDRTGFQFHAWAEAYIDHRWVPADPSMGRLGVPGIYILLGREGDMADYHSRANTLQGVTRMVLAEVR